MKHKKGLDKESHKGSLKGIGPKMAQVEPMAKGGSHLKPMKKDHKRVSGK